MRERFRESPDWRGTVCGGVLLAVFCISSADAADPFPLRLFDLPAPQLRSFARERPVSASSVATNALAAPVEELMIQTKVATEIDLLVQRHEAMNGRPLLSPPPIVRDTSRFQRTLDSLLPRNGTFLQQNPNALSSPLRMSEYWAR